MRQESTTPGMRQDGPLIPMKPFRSLDASIEDDDDEPLIDENGIYVVDDLRLTEDQYKANFGTDEEMRQALPRSKYRWTGGVVPYEFDSTVSADVRGKITSALDTLNKALVNCVVLREKTAADTGNYVKVKGENKGCYSYVGMLNWGAQDLNLGNGCHSDSTIQHEFIHSLGLYHVQSREDRDKYVEIMWDNIKPGKEHNFKKHTGTLTFDVPYDPLSIMHYEYYAFAKDYSKPTIVSKVSDVPTNKLGSAEQLRDSDIKMIRNAYGCDMQYTTPAPICKNKNPDDLCNEYQGWGACNSHEDFMTEWCAKACGKC